MSLITCCPACGTMFRVVPDQLKISEGWVRCGHCSEVFDATGHFVDDVPAAVEDDLNTQPVVEAAADVSASAPVALQAAAAEPAPEPAADAPDSTAPDDPALDRPFVFRRSDLGHSDDAPSVSPPLARESEPPRSRGPRDSSLFDEDEPELQDVGFIRQARRRGFWGRTSVRVFLMLLALALAALLAGQVAVQDRDRLAAHEPALRPVLGALCEALGCTVGPPRMIEAVAIDSSAFNRLRSDAYRLSFSLRNNAAVPVAMPSMELTLTDSQDQPVVRRVITPAELGATAPVLAPASDWSGSVSVAVASGGARIAGYRLLAFYP